MATPPTNRPPPSSGPHAFTVSFDDFKALIDIQIAEGHDILQKIQGVQREADFLGVLGRRSLQYEVRALYDKVSSHVRRLGNIVKEITLFNEPPVSGSSIQAASSDKATKPANRKVFIVHGHDLAQRDAVEMTLHRIKLEPIILANQVSGGLTIIEKLERDGKEAAYAIIIATADDEGHPKGKSDQKKPRARQNVVLELGAFIFALGRKNVAVLCDPGLEHPSDIAGLVYIPLDAAGAWKLQLARELQDAGFDVDFKSLTL